MNGDTVRLQDESKKNPTLMVVVVAIKIEVRACKTLGGTLNEL
jgi:hypothetical protein